MTRDKLWNETQAIRFEDYEEAPPLFPYYFGLEAGERNITLATTGNRYQLNLVEEATKMQFPDYEIRNHADRTVKYHNTSLRGPVDEDDNQSTRDPEVNERAAGTIRPC